MEKFTLFHTALYSKGWYKRENRKTIWEDLKVILTLDDYNGQYMSNGDIVSILLMHCQRLNTRAFSDLDIFANGISKDYCWKYGYYTKGANWVRDSDKLPEYDYLEAIARYCLSNISTSDIKTLCGEGGRLPMPNYEKGLPRKNGITDKKLLTHFVV